MKTTNRILGLDLSLTSTGWCFFADSTTWICDYGVIQPKLKSPITTNDQLNRLITIRTAVTEIIHEHGIPDAVVIEDYSYDAHNKAHQIGELGGVIRSYLFERGLRVDQSLFLVAPTQLKKFATGKGTADKSIIRHAAYKQWGFEDQNAPDDVFDAYVLARIGEALLQTPDTPTLTQYQQDVIAKVKGN